MLSYTSGFEIDFSLLLSGALQTSTGAQLRNNATSTTAAIGEATTDCKAPLGSLSLSIGITVGMDYQTQLESNAEDVAKDAATSIGELPFSGLTKNLALTQLAVILRTPVSADGNDIDPRRWFVRRACS